MASAGLSAALEKVHLDQDDHEDVQEKLAAPSLPGPFRFFDLPSEIRLRIYSFVLFTPRRRKKALRANGSVGASSKNPPRSQMSHRINLYLVSRRMHNEATDFFYSSQIFRLFHIQDYCRLPTIRSISSRYLPSIATLELILGSSWTAPPDSWTVNRELGLEEMTRVRTFKIFIECDPSHPVFEGFRISEGFYTDFAGEIVQQSLKRLPNVVHVEFDAYPSVRKSGALMRRLLQETRSASKQIVWGPVRGWTDFDGEETPKRNLIYELNLDESSRNDPVTQRRLRILNS
ncbi:hypothetical protein P170DRAFT_439353 [Aspergillus steynii IBT 23096]|uniref:F-box domain-containing protein n=1 Tax=Aspergillus steynii IBT 23096 TaxID=1392250 RepID=A0A2I2FY96_9EURO|nr:uncharacterized protein P170DRAFT_439353 [Aspergillus steynii IBT 23096]PLB45614.1 hypothetical protein P170DRAFT_439353 [Aspergillus steynii IBT 23096]